MNALIVDLGLPQKIDLDWKLSNLPVSWYHGYKVFSTFAGGGGSTMGYKLAGYDVVGAVEIDKDMATNYRVNHHPKYLFVEDIRNFKQRGDIPQELLEIDVFDGSPPCSVFSLASTKREKYWGKEKKFREGQKKQRLDDLFFHFLDVAEVLKPKIIIAENVKGLLMGNAKGYVLEVVERFKELGYEVQMFLIRGDTIGLPQSRERVFFVGRRKDLKLPPLSLQKGRQKGFVYSQIEDKYNTGWKEIKNEKILKYWANTLPGKSLASTHPEGKFFTYRKLHPLKPVPTITSNAYSQLLHYKVPRYISNNELRRASSFASDYKVVKLTPSYVFGMAVPPFMMAWLSWQVKDLLDKVYGR